MNFNDRGQQKFILFILLGVPYDLHQVSESSIQMNLVVYLIDFLDDQPSVEVFSIRFDYIQEEPQTDEYQVYHVIGDEGIVRQKCAEDDQTDPEVAECAVTVVFRYFSVVVGQPVVVVDAENRGEDEVDEKNYSQLLVTVTHEHIEACHQDAVYPEHEVHDVVRTTEIVSELEVEVEEKHAHAHFDHEQSDN